MRARWPGSTIRRERRPDSPGGILNGPESFALHLLVHLRKRVPEAAALSSKHRGKEATLGFDDAGTWVPLFRLAGGSASFNVMDLWVRQASRWALTDVRGTSAMVADALAGPLRPFWAFEITGRLPDSEGWNGTSEKRH